jgi:PPOX class probable F420-dependent enzyme
MRRGLQPADLGDLLTLPLVAVLATYRSGGEVLLSPAWHQWRDGGFDVSIGRDDVKARHLRSDPRASILVYEPAPPYRGIELRGSPSFVEKDARATALAIAVRYLGVEAGEAYLAGNVDEESGITLRLEPGQVRAWDFSDEYLEARADRAP